MKIEPNELEALRQAVWEKAKSEFGHLIHGGTEISEALWTEMAARTSASRKGCASVSTLKDQLHPGETYARKRPDSAGKTTLDQLCYFLCRRTFAEYMQYGAGVDAGGFTVVDANFLRDQLARGEAKRYSALDFYCHVVHVQWWGIAKGLGVVRGPLKRVEEHIRREMGGYSPIKAVLLGPGGIGKSTMARIIAAELVDEFEVVWVESSEVSQLMEQDMDEWQPGYGSRRLYFLDNWNKVPVPEQQGIVRRWEQMERDYPDAQIGFVLSSQDLAGLGKELVPFRIQFDLQADGIDLAGDNQVLVDRVLGLFEGDESYSAAVARMKALVAGLDLGRSLPFHLCYFLIRALQEPELERALPGRATHATDRAKAYFEAIVEAELDRLEGSGLNGQAVVRALGIAARIWEEYRHKIYSSSFVVLLKRFGYSSTWGGEVSVDEVLSQGNLRFLVGEAKWVVRERAFGNQINFNKDELARLAGRRVGAMQVTVWQDVLRELVRSGEEPILLTMILQNEGNFFSKDECLVWIEDWMARDIENNSYQWLLLSRNSPLRLTQFQREFYWERVAELHHRYGAALAQGFIGLTVDFQRRWRDRILNRNFWPSGKTNVDVMSAVFDSIESTKAKEELAEQLLEPHNLAVFEDLGTAIAIIFVRIGLARKIEFAEKFLDRSYWGARKIPSHIVTACLPCLPSDKQEVYAEELMDLDYWKPGKIPEQVVRMCIGKLESEISHEIASILVSKDYWWPNQVSGHVIASCWKWPAREEKVELATRVLLEPFDKGLFPSAESVAICFGHLSRESKEFVARELLVPGNIDRRKVSHYIHLCLPYLPNAERIAVAKELLEPDFSKNPPVDNGIVAAGCRIMGAKVCDEARELQGWDGKWGIQQRLALAHSAGNNPETIRALNASVGNWKILGYRQGLCFPYFEPWIDEHRKSLADWRKDRSLCFNALKHEGLFPARVRHVCGEILASWRDELELLSADASINYGYLHRALGHPELREDSRVAAVCILGWLRGQNLEDSDRFYALADACRRIVEEGEFPWLVDPYCICEKRRAEMNELSIEN